MTTEQIAAGALLVALGGALVALGLDGRRGRITYRFGGTEQDDVTPAG